ncbi:MAG: AAA family ATPase [Bacillota bacterium]
MIKIEHYANDRQYIRDELRRLELRLQGHLLYGGIDGFAVSHANGRPSDPAVVTSGGYGEPSGVEEALIRLTALINQKKAETAKRGVILSLDRLAGVFGLTALEKEALLICLAADLSPEYRRMLARLETAGERITVGLLCRLLSPEEKDAQTVRHCFAAQAPLIRYRLLEFADDRASLRGSLMSRSVFVSERVVGFICGYEAAEGRTSGFARIVTPTRTPDDLILSEEARRRLVSIAGLPSFVSGTLQGGLLFCLHGPAGAGKTVAAEALCRQWDLPLLLVDTQGMLNADIDPATAVDLLFRESLLLPAVVCFEYFDLLLGDEGKAVQGRIAFLNALQELSWLTVLETGRSWRPEFSSQHHFFCSVEFPLPDCRQREELWRKFLAESGAGGEGIDIPALAGRFFFTPGRIREAVYTARSFASMNPGTGGPSTEDLFLACRSRAFEGLGGLASRISPRYAISDIVLPAWQTEQVRDIVSRVKNQATVYERWGFGRKFSGGGGLKVLFTGPPGTGKTMAAEVVAYELGIDLYKINLAFIVSKYVGETEKNLEQVFTSAQSGGAVLFFDEADALFGKRTEIKDSHDRYANIETGYLLQKMEEHEGLVILATNRQKNMDEAFTRRLHFIVEFPLPAEEHRYRIWKAIFPAGTPLEKDIDFGFLAGQFAVTGGSIRNIALDGAFLAAREGQAVGMKHLLQAVRRELQKIGRTCKKDDFGVYSELVDAKPEAGLGVQRVC